MAKTSHLRNSKRIRIVKLGEATYELQDVNGQEILAFTYFMDKLRSYPFNTRKAYAIPVSLFIDYLIESGTFEGPVTSSRLNDVIDSYPVLLRDGSVAVAVKTAKNLKERPQDEWLIKVAVSLARPPMRPGSFDNILAGINLFLEISKQLAAESFERATFLGLEHGRDYSRLIKCLEGTSKISRFELQALRQNSMLGNVIAMRGATMRRPRRMHVGPRKVQSDIAKLDFPIERFLDVTAAATCRRDEALWLLIGGCGLRPSEARNLRWADIDIENMKVYIYDPLGRHLGADLNSEELLRFKGRNMSITHFIKPFRNRFFKVMSSYIRDEYVATANEHQESYVFQYVEAGRRGRPYVTATDTTLVQSFARACARVGVLKPKPGAERDSHWTLKSLRHMYGVYMLNDFPVDKKRGIYGLSLSEVQMLMGHASITSTKHYARTKRRNLEDKLEASDRESNLSDSIDLLPSDKKSRAEND